MGSSLGPVVANLYMDYLLSDYKNIFPYKPLFFFKYVDNILTALPQDKIIPTLNTYIEYSRV